MCGDVLEVHAWKNLSRASVGGSYLIGFRFVFEECVIRGFGGHAWNMLTCHG